MSSNLPEAMRKRTLVNMEIEDPVEKARAELKATLAAIEQKTNVPRRVGLAAERGTERARELYERDPLKAAMVVAAGAVVTGAVVWQLVRKITRG